MEMNELNAHRDINQLLGIKPPSSRRRKTVRITTLVVVLLLGALTYLLLVPANSTMLRFETAEVKKGDLKVTVTATGHLQPMNQVDVGSELSGTIDSVKVDFNDHVHQGQVLAHLNTDQLLADVGEARAILASDQAKLDESNATVQETKQAFLRCEKLATQQLCSGEALDTKRAAYTRAQAIAASSRAQVTVARAALEGAETKLNKANILSPIDGLVLQRKIEQGQTVAASFEAPVLFTLAEDLTQMELHVAIDEADVGRVAEGQTAEFTVDAYPERSFPATITQIRFAPETVDDVVTYKAVLTVDNADLTLRPGMTATAVISVHLLQDAILLPNAALRFLPPTLQATEPSGQIAFGSGIMFPTLPSTAQRSNKTKNGRQKVWVLDGKTPKAVMVTTGASDGMFTEIKSAELQPGQAVIIDTIETM
jgi:HlyD family secretion protein